MITLFLYFPDINVDVISMDMALPTHDTPVVWSGAIRHKAVQQFLEDTSWTDKDLLVIDLPPGYI